MSESDELTKLFLARGPMKKLPPKKQTLRKTAGGRGGNVSSSRRASYTTSSTRNIVGEVTAEKMAGDNVLEKELNAYLTKKFVYSHDLPADECLSEAREVIRMVYEAIGIDLVTKLHREPVIDVENSVE